MKAKILLLLFLLMISQLINPILSYPANVDVIGSSLINPNSEGVFYANGLYWIFTAKDDSSGFGYYTSPDGRVWSNWRPLTYSNGTQINFDYDASVHFDGQKVMIAGNIYPYGVFYIQGTPLSNGSITWDWEAFQVSDLIGALIDVTRRSDGNPVVSFIYMWSIEPRNYTGYIYVCLAENGAGVWERKASIQDAYEIVISSTSSGTIYAITRNDTQINYYALFSNDTLHYYGSNPNPYYFGLLSIVSYNDTVFAAYGSYVLDLSAIVVSLLNETYANMWLDLIFTNNSLNSSEWVTDLYTLAYDSNDKCFYLIYDRGEYSPNILSYIKLHWMDNINDHPPVDITEEEQPFSTLISSGANTYVLLSYTTYIGSAEYLYHAKIVDIPGAEETEGWHIIAYNTWIFPENQLIYSDYYVDDPDNNTYFVWFNSWINTTSEIYPNEFTSNSFGLSCRNSNISLNHIYWEYFEPRTTLYVIPRNDGWTYVRLYYNNTEPLAVCFTYSGFMLIPYKLYETNYNKFLSDYAPNVYINKDEKYLESKFKTLGTDPLGYGDDRYKLDFFWTFGSWYSWTHGGVIYLQDIGSYESYSPGAGSNGGGGGGGGGAYIPPPTSWSEQTKKPDQPSIFIPITDKINITIPISFSPPPIPEEIIKEPYFSFGLGIILIIIILSMLYRSQRW